jgi:hypothetical protein
MSNAQRRASDLPAKTSEVTRLAKEWQRSLTQVGSSMEAIKRETDATGSFLKMLASLDADGQTSYSDQIQQFAIRTHQLAMRSRSQADVVAEVRQGLSTLSMTLAQRQNASSAEPPPRIGEFLICLFVRPDRQEDRLADFAERFQTLWLPRFGTCVAGAVYVVHVLWSAADFVKIMALAAVADRIFRAWGVIAGVVERVLRALGW